MSKNKDPKNVPLAETYTHLYNGKIQPVQITVHINYHERTISLVDTNPGNPNSVKGKQFIFSNRTLDYMKGWHDITDAIKSAVDDATKKLQDHAKRMADHKEQMLVEAAKGLNE